MDRIHLAGSAATSKWRLISLANFADTTEPARQTCP
jgi:hypothetical protein